MAAERDAIRRLEEESFQEGQETVAQEVSAERMERRAEAAKKVIKAVGDVFELAEEMAKGGSPERRRFADLVQKRIVDAADRASEDEGRGALEATPFLKGLPNSETTPQELPTPEAANVQADAPAGGLPKPPAASCRRVINRFLQKFESAAGLNGFSQVSIKRLKACISISRLVPHTCESAARSITP